MNYWLIFFTGLTSGGVTCAAMQGGLLVSAIASYKKDLQDNPTVLFDWLAVLGFMVAKFISHFMLGFGLGWLGSTVSLSENARLFFQGVSALIMIVSALNLLEVHKIFRYFSFAPPAFARRLIKGNQALGSIFAPTILGFLTVLIPCGVTQAMEVQAVVSGSPLQGALIMGSFVLGTVPMFMVIGLATARLSETWRSTFLHVAAFLLIIMSLYSVNGILTAIDSPYSVERVVSVLRTPIGAAPTTSITNGIQKVTINITNSGYTPRTFTVKSGIPVELKVMTGDVYSCATAFTFKAFGINTYVKPNTNQVFTFTPNKQGRYTFSCSMGMYSGTMEVI